MGDSNFGWSSFVPLVLGISISTGFRVLVLVAIDAAISMDSVLVDGAGMEKKRDYCPAVNRSVIQKMQSLRE